MRNSLWNIRWKMISSVVKSNCINWNSVWLVVTFNLLWKKRRAQSVPETRSRLETSRCWKPTNLQQIMAVEAENKVETDRQTDGQTQNNSTQKNTKKRTCRGSHRDTQCCKTELFYVWKTTCLQTNTHTKSQNPSQIMLFTTLKYFAALSG